MYGNPAVKDSDFDFIQIEGNALKDTVGKWFGTLFWVIGAISLFGAALGIIDYVSRLVADVLRVGYLRESKRWTESQAVLRRRLVMIASGSAILLSGFDQPLALVVIAAAFSGGVMFIYSMLLLVINRRFLPEPLKVRGVRIAALLWAVGLFGVMSVLVVINEATG